MGFGGSTAAMITSLKNNSRRNKREAFEGWTTSDNESTGIKIAPVSEEQLQEIRDKLKRERKKENIRIILIAISSILLTILFIKFLFFYFENPTGISDKFLYKQ